MGDAPFAFLCPAGRRERWRDRNHRMPPGHERIVRTGRTKPNPSRNIGPRTLNTLHEFECQCGHVGWSRHVDILNYPLAEDAR